MSDVSAAVLSIGESSVPRAMASVRAQTLPVHDVFVVENVSPFHRALNEAARRVRTPYFVQVDADMVLDPECVAVLRAAMGRNTGTAIAELRDPLMGQVVGVKLFRTEAVRRVAMRDSISPDTDLVVDLRRAGWHTVFIGDHGRRRDGTEPRPTYGEHRPEYTPAYAYRKFLLEGRRCRYRGAFRALQWRFHRLDEVIGTCSSFERVARVAQIAAARGFFLDTERDGLTPLENDPECRKVVGLLDAEGRVEPGLPLLPLDRDARLGEVFERFASAGATMARANAGATFLEVFSGVGMSGSRQDAHGLVARVALCHGMFAPGGSLGDRAAAATAVKALVMLGIGRSGLSVRARAHVARAVAWLRGGPRVKVRW